MNAIFPGSFDPLTKGHYDLIYRASRIMDHLTVAVMTNTSKKALFTTDEKVKIIKDAVAELNNVDVIAVEKGLTVDLARKLNATVIIRGVRDTEDFEFEKKIANLNRKLNSEIETLLLSSSPEFEAISSSMIKEIAKFGGDVSQFVNPTVQHLIEEKINEKEN